MKKLSLLVFSVVLAATVAGCTKENASEKPLAGIDIEVGENNTLFIMNQGAWPAGSTLDVKNLSTGAFVADWFGGANPSVTQGLGNTGNDMAIIGGKLWALMNASNMIAIVDPANGKLERFLDVDSPRYIIKKGDYAYVTSYGAAIDGSVYGVKGKVYRIKIDSYEMSSLEVGYQPEGITVLGDKLYVANSGGYQFPHDNSVSVIDLAKFSVSSTLTLPVENLNRLFSASGKLWVTTYDCYNADWSAITTPASLGSIEPDGTYTAVPDVTPGIPALVKDIIYVVSYDGIAKVSTADGSVARVSLKDKDGGAFRFAYPYGLAVHPASGDIYVSDANFTGDSQVVCFAADGSFKWAQASGVGSSMLLIY